MKRSILIFLALSLSACQTVPTNPAPAGVPPVAPAPKPTNLEASCAAPGTAQAFSMSVPSDQKFLDAMKYVLAADPIIIRYGDYVNETIKGKTPKADEIKRIHDSGFKLLVIFQHNNSNINSFTAARGDADAKRMFELYPGAPAFYFGVDGEFESSSEQAAVKIYAQAFAKVTRNLGKKVGAYGAGLTLKNLLAAGLIDYAWVANASRWAGTPEFTASKKWVLVQSLPKNCGGKNGEFNVANPSVKEFGQW